MNLLKSFLIGLTLISVSVAQAINIEGKVTDSLSTPLTGASVKLEKAGLTAMTLSDGCFSLSTILIILITTILIIICRVT